MTAGERWRCRAGPAARDTGRVRADVLDLGARPLLIIWVFDVRMITRKAVPVYASSLMEAVRCHLGAAGAPPAPSLPACPPR
ncbi:MAG TPA: hypothetical protein VMV92_19120 [Streptosporangiaceae bacterium]|nr:hypothetical protein [Streptosporangiaceae bacterium]